MGNEKSSGLIQRAWSIGKKIDTTDILYGPDHFEPLKNFGHQAYFSFFAGLANAIQANNIIEIGTWYGSATRAFERGCVKNNNSSNVKIVTIDEEQRNLDELGQYNSVIPITGNPLNPKVISRIASILSQDNVDILYIDDPQHAYKYTLACLGCYFMLFKPKLVIIDDIHRTSDTQEIWCNIKTRWPQQAIELEKIIPAIRPAEYGLGLLDFSQGYSE